jgi:hypothetical protein
LIVLDILDWADNPDLPAIALDRGHFRSDASLRHSRFLGRLGVNSAAGRW